MPTTPSVTTPTYYYTSQEDVSKIISAKGISLRLDHLSAGDQLTYWTDRLTQVTGTIDMYLRPRYEHADLARDANVRWFATVIMLYRLLLERGGNTAAIEDEYLHVMEQLEKIRVGTLLLPGVPLSANMLPSVVNIIVSPFTESRTTVDPQTSTGGARNLYPQDRMDWFYMW